jgi:hypothetical protein
MITGTKQTCAFKNTLSGFVKNSKIHGCQGEVNARYPYSSCCNGETVAGNLLQFCHTKPYFSPKPKKIVLRPKFGMSFHPFENKLYKCKT